MPSLIGGISVLLTILIVAGWPIRKQSHIDVYRFTLPRSSTETENYLFSDAHVLDMISKKEITSFAFYGNMYDTAKFRILRDEVLWLKYACDTNRVIRIRFKNDATYGEVLEVVRIMHHERMRRYALVGQDFYVFGTRGDDCPDNEPLDSSRVIHPVDL